MLCGWLALLAVSLCAVASVQSEEVRECPRSLLLAASALPSASWAINSTESVVPVDVATGTLSLVPQAAEELVLRLRIEGTPLRLDLLRLVHDNDTL